MAQIVNYWRYPSSVSFGDSDCYTSFYDPDDGKGARTIQVDNDHDILGFPSFDELSNRLSSISYSGDPKEIADLCFACGISVEMGYTSVGSATYVSYVAGALTDKFGYAYATYRSSHASDFYDILEEDMKQARPAELAIRKSEIATGHAIVADGFRSTGEFHLNFGWGSSSPESISEAWYFLPEGMPANYDIVSGGIVNITPQGSTITSVYPSTGVNTRNIIVTIWGSNFSSPQVKLSRNGCPDIIAQNVTVHSSNRLTCSFPLFAAIPGCYDVVVEDLGSSTLPRAFTIYSYLLAPVEWEKTVVGNAESGGVYQVTVGDGDNDGELEVYAACSDHNVYEFTWTGSSWHKALVGSKEDAIWDVTVADGDNDGALEVYASCFDDFVYKFSGKSWQESVVGCGGGAGGGGLAVGDGNNDGRSEVYVGSYPSIYQFCWNGSEWERHYLGSTGQHVFAISIGDGNNDGRLEVYAATTDPVEPSRVYQFAWDGLKWTREEVGSADSWMMDVDVGDGNNDGRLEVYAACWDSKIYQFTWDKNTSNWHKTEVGTGDYMMWGVAVGDADNDSIPEVYATSVSCCGYSKVYQFTWDDLDWDCNEIGSGKDEPWGLSVGDGDNDGLLELYTANWDGTIRQYKVKSPNLLERYAPVLYFHPEEQFYPWGIESMLYTSDLKDENGRIVSSTPCTGDLTTYNSSGYYLDMRNAAPYEDVPDNSRWKGYPYRVYGRQVEKNYEGKDYIVLQYWLFYPFNDFTLDDHEGDWEMIQVLLDKVTQKEEAVCCSHHHEGNRQSWDPEMTISETHPKVFVAKGGHGNWFTSGRHPPLGIVMDYTSDAGKILYPENVDPFNEDKERYELIDISHGPAWTKWQGKWGQPYSREVNLLNLWSSGPKSPQNIQYPPLPNIWERPIEWCQRLSPAEKPSSSQVIASIHGNPLTMTLHAYDYHGNHVGWTETGQMEATIPGTYLYIPFSYSDDHGEWIWIYTSEDLRFEIRGQSGLSETYGVQSDKKEVNSPFATEQIADKGTFDFSFNKYLREEDKTATVSYGNVPFSEDMTAEVDVSPANPGYVMEIDIDGDDVVDKVMNPNTIETESIVASIISPTNNSVVGGKAVILGSARGSDFEQYVLEYGMEDNPTIWTQISSSIAPVSAGILGSWDTTGLEEHTYVIRLSVETLSESTEVRISAVVDNVSPQVDISSPISGMTVSETVEIKGTAWDPHFREYSLKYGEGTTPSSWTTITTCTTPVSGGTLATWDTTSLVDGPWTLRLVCQDEANNISEQTVFVIIDNTPPSVNILFPVSGETVRGVTNITASASDSSGIDRVEFWVDNIFITSDTVNSYQCSWDTTAVSDGAHVIKVIAYDTQGLSGSEAISVKVHNSPTVTWVYPEAGVNTRDIEVTLWGCNFCSPSVRLSRSGGSDIYAREVSVLSGNRMTCTFALSGATPGCYDIVVEDQGCFTSPRAFTIYSPIHYPVGWEKQEVGSGELWMYGVIVGDGDNDGFLEIYAACGDNKIYQFTWDGSAWQKSEVGSGGYQMPKVVIGDPDNDGSLEVYAACWDCKIYQFTWDGSNWQKREIIGFMGSSVWSVTVGDGDNDGFLEIYAACSDNKVYQFTWDGSAWQKSEVGLGQNYMRALAIGDGDNDGSFEIYAACEDSKIYQFTWDGSAWQKSEVGSGWGGMLGVAVGDGDNDGNREVYVCSRDHRIYQFISEGSVWQRSELGCGIGLMWGVTVGDGDNDGFLEVYGNSSDYKTYQFTMGAGIPPNVELVSPESGDVVSGTIDITASATDDSGIARVEFYHDTIFIASTATNSYAVSWATSEVSDKTCTLKAVAYDTQGLSNSDAILVTVDNTNPEAQISSPLSGETVSGKIDIEGTARDANFKEYSLEYGKETSPLSWASITTSAVPISDDTLATWDTTGVDDGTYTIKLTCEDEAGNTSEDQVVAIVNNFGPVISHTQATSTTYNQDLPLTAAVSSECAISSVTIYYRKGGRTSYNSTLMAVGSDYEGTIPGSAITERGLEYYLKTEDIYGKVTTLPKSDASASPIARARM